MDPRSREEAVKSPPPERPSPLSDSFELLLLAARELPVMGARGYQNRAWGHLRALFESIATKDASRREWVSVARRQGRDVSSAVSKPGSRIGVGRRFGRHIR